jgi:hypothetical protein
VVHTIKSYLVENKFAGLGRRLALSRRERSSHRLGREPIATAVGDGGCCGGDRGHSVVNPCSLAFFDRHLKGKPAALLDGPAEQYPGVLFESRRLSGGRALDPSWIGLPMFDPALPIGLLHSVNLP